MSDKVIVPWTAEQVDTLNEYQALGLMHPYTCGKCRANLLATPSGWICRHDDYRQNWAHAFSANREALSELKAAYGAHR